MRAWCLVMMVCLSCGKTAQRQGVIDATADVATVATDSAGANDAPVQDALLAPDDARGGPDLGGSPDLPPDNACSSLSVTPLALEPVPYCVTWGDPSVCPGGDKGAFVARSADCITAWNSSPLQCAGWPLPADDQELVVLDVPNCLDSFEVDSARACADHIEVAYTVNSACQACDGTRPIWRAFLLPRDPRPVIATGRTIIPPCPPPPPGTGGTTGGTAPDSGCPPTRIDTTQAAAAYAAYRGLASSATIQAQEETVPGLWEEMHAQLFTTKQSDDSGAPPRECSFIYRECVLALPADDCNMFGPIASGVATNGAFYFSWGWGSGMYRTNFGKLAPSGAGLVRTTSGGYFNYGYGPPPLVIALEAGQILVYRPAGYPRAFNQWQSGTLVGTLKDFGDRLAIVDGNEQEIPATLP